MNLHSPKSYGVRIAKIIASVKTKDAKRMTFAVMRKGEPMRLIDANELILWTDKHYAFEKFTVAYFANMVKDMPTIEERKTGKWVDAVSSDHYKCSICGYRAPYSSPYCEWLSDYCPSCGAKMEGNT